MASLNLADWRRPGIQLVLRRQYRRVLTVATVCALLVTAYYLTFNSRLIKLEQQLATLNVELNDFELVAKQVSELQQDTTAATKQRSAQQTHAQVIAEFIKLLDLTQQGIQISSIHRLKHEVKISGSFLRTESVKLLENQLTNLLNNSAISVQFSAPRQFVIRAIIERAS